MSDVSWGLDLAGFSTGKSALARAARTDQKKALLEIFLEHPFMNRIEGRDLVASQLKRERSFITECDQLYIDMPIDLQNLPSFQTPIFSWQLTKRPIDFAYSAMPPFADRIGSPVARLQAILEGQLFNLGSKFFETYPAMSLEKWLGRPADSYKHATHTADWDGDRWVGESGLAELMNKCRFVARSDIRINDDQFDACLCAIVGIVEPSLVLAEADLDVDITAKIREKIRKKDLTSLGELDLTAPKGYRILKATPNDWIFEVEIVQKLPSDISRIPGIASVQSTTTM